MPWYQTGWKVAMAGLAGILAVIVLGFIGLVSWNWWQITHGRGDELARKINALAQSRAEVDTAAAALRQAVETADDPYIGAKDAPIIIVEFLDFQCPFCQASAPILRALAQKYPSKVKIIFRDYPVDSINPVASKLAEFASCAHEQGAYWAAHDYFFAHQSELPETWAENESLSLAARLGINQTRLSDCLRARRGAVEMNDDFADGLRYGARSTPTFFVNGVLLKGSIPLDVWEEIINKF